MKKPLESGQLEQGRLKKGRYIMSKYFKNVKSLEDLKKQYKKLVVANHPDVTGGDHAVLAAINVEYDALFPIWSRRKEAETGEKVVETANSTRTEFYTQNGWEGSNHDWNRSLKEIAQIVRTYIKEQYPTYKFSVRTSYASMCQELHVELKESPVEIYKRFEDLTEDDMLEIAKRLYPWGYMADDMIAFLNMSQEEKKNMVENSGNAYTKILNEITKAVVEDVDNFVNSYNYEDWDGMIDYFHVDFYYFGCCQNNGEDVKIVPKTARIKNKATAPAKSKNATPKQKEAVKIEDKENMKPEVTYKVTQGEDTRDGSVLWIVRIVESLSKEDYILQNKKMKNLGGYYSKFKHGFLFHFDPTEKLGGVAA